MQAYLYFSFSFHYQAYLYFAFPIQCRLICTLVLFNAGLLVLWFPYSMQPICTLVYLFNAVCLCFGFPIQCSLLVIWFTYSLPGLLVLGFYFIILVVHCSVSSEFVGLKEYRPNIYPDGTVYYNFPSVLESICTVDVERFPYDEQTCKMLFGSWAYHGNDMDLQVVPNDWVDPVKQ